MKNLEKKIIKEVYDFESRQTLTELIVRIILMVGFILVGTLLIIRIFRQLVLQQTLDIFEIFFEDLSTIKENLSDIFWTFIQEAPGLLILFALLFELLAIILLVKFILSFSKVKNKLSLLIKFWFSLK